MDGSVNLVIKPLTWQMREMGLSPSWIQFFSLDVVSKVVQVSKEKKGKKKVYNCHCKCLQELLCTYTELISVKDATICTSVLRAWAKCLG